MNPSDLLAETVFAKRTSSKNIIRLDILESKIWNGCPMSLFSNRVYEKTSHSNNQTVIAPFSKFPFFLAGKQP